MSGRLLQQLRCAVLHMCRCTSPGNQNHDHGNIDSGTLSAVTLHQPDLEQYNPHLDPNLTVGSVLLWQWEPFLVVEQAVWRTLQLCSLLNSWLLATYLSPWIFSSFSSLPSSPCKMQSLHGSWQIAGAAHSVLEANYGFLTPEGETQALAPFPCLPANRLAWLHSNPEESEW